MIQYFIDVLLMFQVYDIFFLNKTLYHEIRHKSSGTVTTGFRHLVVRRFVVPILRGTDT